jgi:hypothetical protein
MKTCGPSERGPAAPQGSDGARSRGGEPGERLASARLCLHTGESFVPRRMLPQAEHGGFGAGPWQIGVATLRARRALALAGRCCRPCDQPTRGDDLLSPGAALAILAFGAHPHAQHRAHAGPGLQERPGMGVLLRRGVGQGPRLFPENAVRGIAPGAVDCDPVLAGGVGNPLGSPRAMALIGELGPDLRQMVRPVGLRHVGQERGPWVPQRHPPPAQVPGGPHGGGLDRGRRAHPAPEQDGNVVRVHRVGCRLAPVHGVHGEGMAEAEGDAGLGTHVREPGPRSTGTPPRPRWLRERAPWA